MSLGEKISVLRTKCGYSQEYLAEKLNVSRQAVSKWELDTAAPDADKIVAISEFFGVSTDYLLKDHVAITTSDTLDRIVLKFLSSAQEMDGISKALVEIMKDGIIDELEQEQMKDIIATLDSITDIIHEMKRKMNIK